MKTKVFIINNGTEQEKTYLPVVGWNRLFVRDGVQFTRLNVIGIEGAVLLLESKDEPARFTDITGAEVPVVPYAQYEEALEVCEAFRFSTYKRVNTDTNSL